MGADLELQRASSMNLPKPEESGVPATHPDMCILRIRRNHLVEVSLHSHATAQVYLMCKRLSACTVVHSAA